MADSTSRAENVPLTLAENAMQARLREKLNAENVKLWQQPFYDESALFVNDAEILALASRYGTELALSDSEVVDCLFSLQRNAIERLAERDIYKNTGLATLRLKYSGLEGAGNAQKLQISLGVTGKELKTSVAQLLKVPENRLKLISAGRVINENNVLRQQNIKNGGGIMVLVIGTDREAFQQSEDQFKLLEDIKTSADYLASKDIDNMYSLQVADQSGKPLDLPDTERKALAVSLALHDKGRSALKSNEFSKALVFLLEADSVYSQCHSSLLDMVDNYGMLNLDIAWCYLSLQSISELPAVETRLAKSEKALHRSYGENLERVIALKGSSGWETALFVRLHLLQGIAAFHFGQNEKAKFYIRKVDTEIARLKISDDHLAGLINMGYGAGEARMALRATFGDVQASVDWIIRRREETNQIQEQEKENSKRRKLQKRLGNCSNGDPVSVPLFRNLKEMGFNPTLAMEALKQTNNDINSAIQLVNDAQFISTTIAKIGSRVMNNSGVSTSAVAAAAAIAANLPPGLGVSSLPSHLATVARELLDQSFSDESLDVNLQATAEEHERSATAYENLSKNMCSEADYIDLSLTAETEYLNRYKDLLQL